MPHQVVYGRKAPEDFSDDPEYIQLLTDDIGRIILSDETDLTISLNDDLNLQETQLLVKTELEAINTKLVSFAEKPFSTTTGQNNILDKLETIRAEVVNSKTELISINNKTIQVDRETDNAYFAGNLTAGDVTDTIDLGIRTIIQFGGRSDTANFSFVIEYSNDGVIFSTDGFEPELTLVGTQHRFNLTRTNICMRFVRLLCRTSGTNVVIAYSTIQ